MNPLAWIGLGLGAAIAAAGLFLALSLGLHRPACYLDHFEAEAYGGSETWSEPLATVEGLAVYARGEGEPLLLFPYPHAHTICPMIDTELAELFVAAGRRVISFDVPGAYRSTRPAVGDLAEMLSCAEEALTAVLGPAEARGQVDVAGHSMGSLCALALSIERPGLVKRLVLEGSMSGFPAAVRAGLPGSAFGPGDREYWEIMRLGLRASWGKGSLAEHKRLMQIFIDASVVDPALRYRVPTRPGEAGLGSPIRNLWSRNLFRNLDYAKRLGKVAAPTLILVGRHDPQTPTELAEELAAGIAGSRLRVFEASGHSPHLEEAAGYRAEVEAFWAETAESGGGPPAEAGGR